MEGEREEERGALGEGGGCIKPISQYIHPRDSKNTLIFGSISRGKLTLYYAKASQKRCIHSPTVCQNHQIP